MEWAHRHPKLSICKPEKLSTTRARMTISETITKYFHDLGEIIRNLGLESKPSCIWNCDETEKSFGHQPLRIIDEKGSKTVVGRTSSCRTNITVMACVNAAGSKMSPLFIVKGKRQGHCMVLIPLLPHKEHAGITRQMVG